MVRFSFWMPHFPSTFPPIFALHNQLFRSTFRPGRSVQFLWRVFSNAITGGRVSVQAFSCLLSGICFLRIILPISAATGALIVAAILFGLMPFYGAAFGPHLLLLPPSLLAFAVGIRFRALNVKYRDVRSRVPLHARMGTDTTRMDLLWHAGQPTQWWLGLPLGRGLTVLPPPHGAGILPANGEKLP
jgi:hypothetical protein